MIPHSGLKAHSCSTGIILAEFHGHTTYRSLPQLPVHCDTATYTTVYSRTKSMIHLNCAQVHSCPGHGRKDPRGESSHQPRSRKLLALWLCFSGPFWLSTYDSPVLEHISHTNRNYLLFLSNFQRGCISVSYS